MATSPLQSLLDQFSARLDLVESTLGISGSSAPAAAAAAAPGAGAAAASEDAASIKAYDEFSKAHLDDIAAAAGKIGVEQISHCADLFQRAWAAQRSFLVVASKCKKPDDKTKMSLMQPIIDVLKETQAATKRDDFENYFKTVSESISCCNWLLMDAPMNGREYIEAQLGSADYAANKIRLQYKRNTDKFDENQHLLLDSMKKLLKGLVPYTKAHHLTGVSWNFKGEDAKTFSVSSASAPAPAPAAAPKPAPAAAAAAPAAAAPSGGGDVGIADLKNQLGQFSTKGLKKVTKDMQTWRKEFKGEDAPAAAPKKKTAVAPRPVAVKTKGTKMVEFKRQGMRWCVEAQTKDDGTVTVDVNDVKHSVNIYGCFMATIELKGKCKGVTIDSCERCTVYIDSAISAVELVNCKRMHVHVREKAPVVNIDKTDGCVTHLPATSLDTTFTTAKSSEMNVEYPNPADGELKEVPIPEQFVHALLVDSGKMSAEVSDLYA